MWAFTLPVDIQEDGNVTGNQHSSDSASDHVRVGDRDRDRHHQSSIDISSRSIVRLLHTNLPPQRWYHSSDHQQQSLFSISILHLINHILFLISQNFNHISITFQSNNSHPNLFHFHFLFLFIYFKPFHKLKPLPTIQHTRTITIYLNYLPMAPTKITFQMSLNFLPTYLLSS